MNSSVFLLLILSIPIYFAKGKLVLGTNKLNLYQITFSAQFYTFNPFSFHL